MVVTKKALPRRTVLRGMGITLGLPLLDAMVPALSASSTMLTPMRSFTLWQGLKPSSLASTVAPMPAVSLLSRTSGVRPMVLVMSE